MLIDFVETTATIAAASHVTQTGYDKAPLADAGGTSPSSFFSRCAINLGRQNLVDVRDALQARPV